MAALADNWDDESGDDWENDVSDDNEDAGDEKAGKDEEVNLTAQQSLKNMIDAFDIEARRSFRTGKCKHSHWKFEADLRELRRNQAVFGSDLPQSRRETRLFAIVSLYSSNAVNSNTLGTQDTLII